MKINQKDVVVGVSIVLVATLLFFTLKKDKTALAKDISTDEDFKKLLDKIDKAPK